MSEHANQAIEALGRRNLTEAMRAGLEWWRADPSPKLAEQLATLETLLPEGERDGVTARLLGVVNGGNSVKSRKNVEALSAHPADPRLTTFLIDVIGAPPFDVSSGNPEAFIRAAIERLLAQPDPRVSAWREGLAAFLEARRGTRRGQLSRDEIATISRIVAACPPARPPTASNDPRVDDFARALEPFLRARRAGRDAQERLLTEVVQHFDDARMLVYADSLSEQGAAQGELITRMLAGETTGLEALQRAARPRCFGSARLEWEKGFVVKAFFADRDGIRSGTWGPELEWGTVRECDVIPSEGCHAERLETLHVGATYVKDLARRTTPLPVKTLVLRHLNERAADWKRVTALTALERIVVVGNLELRGLIELLETPMGRRVKSVENTSGWWRGQLLSEALPVFDSARQLETIRLPNIVLSRDRRLTLELVNVDETAKLVIDLSKVKRPLCDVVTLVGPEALTNAPALRSLGTRVEVKAEKSTLLSRAKLVCEDGRLVITPDAGVVFDASAFQEALERHHPAAVELERGADFCQLSQLWNLATAAGATRLTLRRGHGDKHVEQGPHQHWYGGPFSVTVTQAESTWQVGGGGPALLALAVVGLPRVERATLHLAGALAGQATELKERLRIHAGEVTVKTADPLTEWTTRFVKAAGRLELRAAGDAATLQPSTLSALLAGHPKTKSVLVFQRSIDFAPWLDWVTTHRLPLDFRVPNVRPDGPIRFWWDKESLRVSLSLRRDLVTTLPPLLFSLPAKRIDHLELVHFEPIPPAWVEVAKHLAKTSSSRRP